VPRRPATPESDAEALDIRMVAAKPNLWRRSGRRKLARVSADRRVPT
jgi:hypothetical protein